MTDDRIPDEAKRRCQDCGTPIVLAHFPSGYMGPINAEPVTDGRFVIAAWHIEYERGNRRGPRILLDYADRETEPDEPRYTAHPTSCRRPIISRRGHQFATTRGTK